MSVVGRAHHVGVTVSSLEDSLAFYRDLLGLEVVFQWNPRAPYIGTLVGYHGVDLHSVILAMPGTDVCLELLEYRGVERRANDMGTANPGNSHLAFFVDDLDAVYERLRNAGVGSVSDPVTPTIGPNAGGRVVYMLDPDGVRIELIQSSQPFNSYATQPADESRSSA